MCLNKIVEEGLDEKGVGYKLYVLDPERGLYYAYGPYVQIGEEVVSKNKGSKINAYSVGGSFEGAYNSGYHIFLHLDDARLFQKTNADCGIYAVEYENGHTKGFQKSNWPGADAINLQIIIADKIKITKKIDEPNDEIPPVPRNAFRRTLADMETAMLHE